MEDTEDIKKKLSDGVYKLRKKQNGKSIIWNFFTEIEKEDGLILVERVYCKGCDKVFKYTKKQTSNLIKHKCVHTRPIESSPVVLNMNDKNECFEAFLNFLINDCRPLSIVEGAGFKEMIDRCIKIGAKYGENVDLASIIPSAKDLSEKIKLMAEEKKEEIKPHLKDVIENGDCAVTIDLWTDSIMKRNFLCATLHFQINYDLINITLGMRSMDLATNSALNIRAKLGSIFEEYDVNNMTNVVFVTDRRMEIKSALKDLTRINCSADLFSNFLNDAFELTTELKDLIESCKQIMIYFKKVNMRHMLNTTLKCHCATKWYSNFEMFKSIYENYGKISKILGDNEETRNMLNFN